MVLLLLHTYNDGKRYTKVMQHRPVPSQLLFVSQFCQPILVEILS